MQGVLKFGLGLPYFDYTEWAVLTIPSTAMFIIVIDTTIMNVSISALVEDLNTTVGGVQSEDMLGRD